MTHAVGGMGTSSSSDSSWNSARESDGTGPAGRAKAGDGLKMRDDADAKAEGGANAEDDVKVGDRANTGEGAKEGDDAKAGYAHAGCGVGVCLGESTTSPGNVRGVRGIGLGVRGLREGASVQCNEGKGNK